VAPPFRETLIAGLLQPWFTSKTNGFAEATATIPGRDGSAATLGSIPLATKYSRTCGAGGEVGLGEAVTDGAMVAIVFEADSAGPDATGAPADAVALLADGTRLGDVAMIDVAVVMASSNVPTSIPARTRITSPRTRSLRRGFATRLLACVCLFTAAPVLSVAISPSIEPAR
jgi:hypothetical protein